MSNVSKFKKCLTDTILMRSKTKPSNIIRKERTKIYSDEEIHTYSIY